MRVGLIPLILSLVFPACGTPGAKGIKPPGAVDFNALTLPKTPNYALAAPAGFTPAPTFITPDYKIPPAALFTLLSGVAAAQPRTFLLDSLPPAGQAAWVVRSRIANFPDIVEAKVAPAPGGDSRLILFGYSIYGRGDFGVNKGRLRQWLTEIGRQAEEFGVEHAQ